MITKGILAAQVADLLTVGKHISSESAINKRYLMKLADSVYGELIKQNYFEQRQIEGDYQLPEAFIKPYKETVKQDTERDLLYADVPGLLLATPDRGISRISFLQDEEAEIIPMYGGAASGWNELESASLDGKLGYYPEGTIFIFYNMDSEYIGSTVMIRMVGGISELEEDEEITLPADMEYRMITMIRDLYIQQPPEPEDLSADSS